MSAADGVWSLMRVAHTAASKAGRHVVNYQEVWEDFGDKLPPGSIVQVWSSVRRDNFSAPTPIEDITKHYPVIWSEMGSWCKLSSRTSHHICRQSR